MKRTGKTTTPFLRLLPERSTKTRPSFTTKNICLKFGGLMPPPKREAVKKFFENAENKGTIWECKQRHKKE